MSKEVALTTVDNPFDPFEQFTLWDLFDHEKGYNTKERLARIVNLSDDMTQNEEDEEIERAIDEIIRYDFLNIYKKVVRNQKNTEESGILATN
jgi:hypothetical protein